MKGPGRPRKPQTLKLVAGTFRRSREKGRNEPKPEPSIPSIPAHLSDAAKAEWERISKELAALGLLTQVDRAALAAYCECWSDWIEASKFCATVDGKDRKVIRTAAGNLIENPYFSIKKRTAELMHKFLTEFGMTPAARTSPQREPDNPTPADRWKNFRK